LRPDWPEALAEQQRIMAEVQAAHSGTRRRSAGPRRR
jgi:hypothetical protein